MPIASGVVCIWICTESDSSDVTLAPDGIGGEPLFSRRLFVAKQRVTVFAYRAVGFRDGGGGEYAYRRGAAKEEVRGRATIRLADWDSPFVSNVVLFLINSLQASERPDLRPLARFLRLASAWRVPCLFSGSIGDLRLAVVDLRLPRESHRARLLAIEASRAAAPDVETIEIEQGLCLLWRDVDVVNGFLDIGTELLEFVPGASVDGPQGVREWSRSLGQRDRSRIVEQCLTALTEPENDHADLLNDLLDPGATVELGRARWTVHGVALLPAGLFAFVGCDAETEASGLRVRGLVGGVDLELVAHRRLPLGPDRNSQHGEILIYRGDWFGPAEARGPVRLSLQADRAEEFVWLRLLGADTSTDRQRLKRIVPWRAADPDLVEELYFPAFAPEPAEDLRWRLPAIELTPARPTPLAGPLVVTFCDGDIEGLYRSLIGLGLSARDLAATVRILLRDGTEPGVERNLTALCRDYGLACQIVALSAASVGLGLGLTSDDRRSFSLSVLLPCGATPGDTGWLAALTSLLSEFPDVVWWGGRQGEPDLSILEDLRPVACILDQSIGVVALGSKADDAVALPHSQLLTFEGACLDILAKAAARDLLRVDPRLDFYRTGTGFPAAEAIAEARLDRAVLKSRAVRDQRPLRLVASREGRRAVALGKKQR